MSDVQQSSFGSRTDSAGACAATKARNDGTQRGHAAPDVRAMGLLLAHGGLAPTHAVQCGARGGDSTHPHPSQRARPRTDNLEFGGETERVHWIQRRGTGAYEHVGALTCARSEASESERTPRSSLCSVCAAEV